MEDNGYGTVGIGKNGGLCEGHVGLGVTVYCVSGGASC